MLRRLLAFAATTIVLVTVFVVADAPSTEACSCVPDKPVMSTFEGRIKSVNGDAFSFVGVRPAKVANEADASESSRRPTVALAIAGVLLVIAAGMAIQGRKQRTD